MADADLPVTAEHDARRNEWVALLARIAELDPPTFEELAENARLLAGGYAKQN